MKTNIGSGLNWEIPRCARLSALKKKNPQLKLLWSISPDLADDSFFIMYRDSKLRSEFIQAAINFVRLINFDGVEFLLAVYTSRKRKVGTDNKSFVTLLQEMALAFSKESTTSKKPALILNVWVQANIKEIEKDFDIVGISKHVDFLTLDTGYIEEKDTRSTFRHRSPLYGEDESDSHSLDYFARYMVSKGIEKRKLVFGMSTAGELFIQRWYSSSRNLLSFAYDDYTTVCELLKNRIPLFDEGGLFPYYRTMDEGLMYNDPYSLRIKVIYIRTRGYGGVFIVALYYDDYVGACNKGKFPLLTAINDECRRN
ncbi:hypothetical protein Btru_023131 [Bulinus truncatus]|nr:hypothetical protein Btru_023131 [Bulinus truncatus]